ncbi:MAG: TetR family transcriptional regulator [Pseudomonadota bacterium]
MKTKKGHETQTRILDVATALFAEKGFLGVSLREIMTEANANFASAHYYFGSKQSLYEAAAERFFKRIGPARREALAALSHLPDDGADDMERTRRILFAYTQPHYDVARLPGGRDYLRMISRYQAEPAEVTHNFVVNTVAPTRMVFINALLPVLAPMPRPVLTHGFSLFVNAMLAAPVDASLRKFGGQKISVRYIREEMADRLATFGAAGLMSLR